MTIGDGCTDISAHFSIDKVQTRSLPNCPSHKWELAIPLNESLPTNLYKAQKLLSISHVDMEIPTIPPMMPYLNLKIDDGPHAVWNSLVDAQDLSDSYTSNQILTDQKLIPLNMTTIGLVFAVILILYLVNRKIIRVKWLGKKVFSKTGQTIKRRKRSSTVKKWILEKLPTKLYSV